MRYEIGEKIPFLFLEVDHNGKPPFFGPRYLPWDHKLISVTIHLLECKEHHKVPNEWDEERKLKDDGFIFEDETGQRWFNQYPQSHYGQLDDTNDRRVFKADGDSHSGYLGPWLQHAYEYLENLWRGVHQFRTDESTRQQFVSAENAGNSAAKADEYAKLLEDHYNDIKQQIETRYNLKLDIRPLVFKNKKGEEYPALGYFEVFVVK